MHESVSQMGGKRKEEEGGRRSQGFDLPLCPQMKIGTTIKVIPIIHVEHRGVEPLTSTMRMSRATNCANAPCASGSITQHSGKSKRFFR